VRDKGRKEGRKKKERKRRKERTEQTCNYFQTTSNTYLCFLWKDNNRHRIFINTVPK
jgi:hypothetical protein